MIIHFLNDDKFADYAISQFSGPEAESTFVVVSYSGDIPKNIKQSGKLTVIGWKSEAYTSLLKQIHTYKAIILHGLFDPWMEEIIEYTPETVKIAWVFYGGEIYGRPDLRNRYVSTETRLLFFFRKMWIFLKGKEEKNPFSISKKALRRIDYCMTDVHEDFQFVKQYLRNSRMKELWYNYYSIEETLGQLIESSIKDKNILVGNSCNLENNNLAAFRKITKFAIADRKVIVPLSYGSTWLKQYLLKKGNLLLGKSFYPLTVFIDRDAYNKVLSSCSIVVMNQFRPQAMGNILTALWLGAKVYMSKKSKLYEYYKRLGLILFLFENDLSPQNPKAIVPLSIEEREHNRRILMQEYGKENMKQRIAKVVEELTN
jgi:hypothetical protein